MLRATRALSAMLTLGALACTFDHSGQSPGGGDANIADSPGGDAQDGQAGAEGWDGNGDALNSDEEGSGGASTDGGSEPDVSENDVSENDITLPPDGGAIDGSGPEPDVKRFDCGSLPNSVVYMSPSATNPHCYWLPTITANWLGAANACSVAGGHLVTLDSTAETTIVLGLMTTFPFNERLWIGATDGRFSSDGPGSGPFAWITGEPMTYQNWASQQPDGKCQTCGMGTTCNCEHRVAMTNDGHWEDLYEALFYPFVCEAEL
jgi:hypothetical protein